MSRSRTRHSPSSRTLTLVILACSFLLATVIVCSVGSSYLFGQVAVPAKQIDIVPPAMAQCGDGLQVCRCYCRANFRSCKDNQTAFSSMPLCKVAWNNTDCSALGYYQDATLDATSCAAREGAACAGYIRKNDAPDALIGQLTAGTFIGCTITAVK